MFVYKFASAYVAIYLPYAISCDKIKLNINETYLRAIWEFKAQNLTKPSLFSHKSVCRIAAATLTKLFRCMRLYIVMPIGDPQGRFFFPRNYCLSSLSKTRDANW